MPDQNSVMSPLRAINDLFPDAYRTHLIHSTILERSRLSRRQFRALEQTMTQHLPKVAGRNALRLSDEDLAKAVSEHCANCEILVSAILRSWIDLHDPLYTATRAFLASRSIDTRSLARLTDGFSHTLPLDEIVRMVDEFRGQHEGFEEHDVQLMQMLLTGAYPSLGSSAPPLSTAVALTHPPSSHRHLVKPASAVVGTGVVDSPSPPPANVSTDDGNVPRDLPQEWVRFLVTLQDLPVDAEEWHQLPTLIEALTTLGTTKQREHEARRQQLQAEIDELIQRLPAWISYLGTDFGLERVSEWSASTCPSAHVAQTAKRVGELTVALDRIESLGRTDFAGLSLSEQMAHMQHLGECSEDARARLASLDALIGSAMRGEGSTQTGTAPGGDDGLVDPVSTTKPTQERGGPAADVDDPNVDDPEIDDSDEEPCDLGTSSLADRTQVATDVPNDSSSPPSVLPAAQEVTEPHAVPLSYEVEDDPRELDGATDIVAAPVTPSLDDLHDSDDSVSKDESDDKVIADSPSVDPTLPVQTHRASFAETSERSASLTIEEIETQVVIWAGSWDSIPYAYLASDWLTSNQLASPVPPDLLILAHHAFASPIRVAGLGWDDRVESILQERLTRTSADDRSHLWSIGAGLVLFQGQLQALPWLLDTTWTESIPACRRVTDVLVTYWNRTAEPIPEVERRLVARHDDPRLGIERREQAAAILRAMLSRQLKFPLGIRLLVYLREELAWLDQALRGEGDRTIREVEEWAHELDPADALDSWARSVDPTHRVGIVSDTRGALLRDLRALRTAILDWSATAVESIEPTNSSETQAFADLREVLASELDTWRDTWSSSPSTCLGTPLFDLLEGVLPDSIPRDTGATSS